MALIKLSFLTLAAAFLVVASPASMIKAEEIKQFAKEPGNKNQLRGLEDAEVQQVDAGWYWKYTANIFGNTQLPQVSGANVNNIKGGCGSENQKCHCFVQSYDVKKKQVVLVMEGRGTSGTWTDLNFQCGFHVEFDDSTTCDCSLHIHEPWGASCNSWKQNCPCLKGFSWQIPCNGHDYTVAENLVQNN